MSARSKRKQKKEAEQELTLEEHIRASKLKIWKRWMINGDPGCLNGWLICDQSESLAAGW